MKRRILMLLSLITGALFQQILPSWSVFQGMKPPVLASLVLHYGLHFNNKDSLFAVVAAALLQDGLDFGTFGPSLLTFPVIRLLAKRIRGEVFFDGLAAQIVLGAAVGLFTTFASLLLYSLSGQRPFHIKSALLRLSGACLLGMITVPVVFRTVDLFKHAFPRQRRHGWQ